MKLIDSFLDRFSMPFVMKSYLALIIGAAIILSALGVLPFNPADILLANIFLSVVCFGINWLLAKLFKADASPDSPIITAGILTLIVGPLPVLDNLGLLSFLAVASMASKYLLIRRSKHIFNPAALAVVASVLALGSGASWWVGHQWLLPFVLAGGLLMIRKIQRWHLVFSFLVPYIGLLAAVSIWQGLPLNEVGSVAVKILISSPVLFFAFVILVEPVTGPARRKSRVVFGALVALAAVSLQSFAGISYSLELSLLVGNAFVLFFDPAQRFRFAFESLREEADNTASFIFNKPSGFDFIPGQFMEWSLPHKRADQRGNRRWFTIASSPTEEKTMITSRFSQPSSTFKKALRKLRPGQTVSAVGPSGDFLMPGDRNVPMIWIAGGIGITPFRSMAKFLLDHKQKRQITLFYANPSAEMISFKKLFDRCADIGVKTVYTVDKPPGNWKHESGRISPEMITRHAPDCRDAVFYVSGPQTMVKALEKTLKDMGVKKSRIKTDYFPGYGG